MLGLVDRRVIAPTVAARCGLARSVLTIGREYSLLAFRGSDTHVHVESACSEADAFEYARRTEVSLQHRLGLPVAFERARVKPVLDQQHLGNLLHYCFRQEEHHGIDQDPFHTASNLPDLLGMRLLGRYTRDNLRRWLPRIDDRELLSHWGDLDLNGAVANIADLATAAAAAYGVPVLRGNTSAVVQARRAAVHAMWTPRVASGRERPATRVIAEQLGIGPRAVRKLRNQPACERGVRAVTLQLRLRAAMRNGQRARTG